MLAMGREEREKLRERNRMRVARLRWGEENRRLRRVAHGTTPIESKLARVRRITAVPRNLEHKKKI